MKDKQHNEIMFALGELKSDVKSVSLRIDVQNGRLGKLEGRTNSLEETRSEQRGGWKLFAMLGGASVLGSIGTFITNRLMR